jgi:alpha-ketoglutarate-dependent taurine dioxygenase
MTVYTLMPLHRCLGIAVIGVDLAEAIDAETSQHLSRLLADNLVLLFPGQSLSPEQYLAAAQIFGPPLHHRHSPQHMPGYPDIGIVSHRDGEPGAECWRTDRTDRERSPAATMLYAADPPPAGGGTSIADMRAAYWALADEERSRLETLRMVNRPRLERDNVGPDDLGTDEAEVAHPMVHMHPVSRERAVYLDPDQAHYIEGMTLQASQEYVTDLMERMILPDIVYRHDWVKGDVLVIDDRATLYRAHRDNEPSETRTFWRIVVEGEAPTPLQGGR